MIYMFLADGFEEVEALTPYDLLLRAGADIKTVSVTDKKEVRGTHDITVTADMTISELTEPADGVILPGGMPGASNLDACPEVDKILKTTFNENKLIGAICAAPFILGKRGMLQGRDACCYPGFESELKGAKVKAEPVCVDGNIVTARGMGVAFEFGIALIERLFGKDTAASVAEKTMAAK